MNNNQLIKNYAISLFSSVTSKELRDKIFSQLQEIDKFLLANTQCKLLLCAPIVAKSHKLQLIGIVAQLLVVDSTIQRFLFALVNNKRFNIFNDIIVSYHKLLNQSNDIKLATVTASIPLQLDIQTQVTNYLESLLQQKLEIKFCADLDIIGGLVIEYGGYLLDCSVIGALNKIEKITKNIR